MLDFNPGEHICVVGDARPEKTNPIYLAHEKVILILVVERATGLIVDADTNMVCELTRRFLRSVFVGAVRRRPVRPDEVPGQHQSGA